LFVAPDVLLRLKGSTVAKPSQQGLLLLGACGMLLAFAAFKGEIFLTLPERVPAAAAAADHVALQWWHLRIASQQSVRLWQALPSGDRL
jgi:hypothetical protein